MPSAVPHGPARWIAPGLALLAALTYANAPANGFAFDDDSIVAGNEYVHHGAAHLRELLLGSWWPDSRELYRPATLASLAVDWSVGGGRPAWFHAVNVLLHAAAVVLLFRLLLRLGASLAPAAAGAALFAVHPVHVEAVANVVGRAEVLAAIFVLLACLVHLHRAWRPAVRIPLVLALYLLALGAKEIAVTLPALLLALDAFVDRGQGQRPGTLLRGRAVLLAGMAATLGAYLLLRHAALGGGTGTAAAPYLYGLPALDRLAVAFRLWPAYLRLLLWPVDLSADWGPGAMPVATWHTPAAWLGAMTLVALLGLARRDWLRGTGWAALAVAWLAIALLPVSQLLFPIGTMLAERTMYLPSVALAFLPAALAPACRPWPRAARAVACAAVLALGTRTWLRTPVWRSTDAVWADLQRSHPDSWRALWHGATAAERQGRLGEALPLYLRALDQSNANNYLLNTGAAQLLLRLGHTAEAEALLRRAVARDPDLLPAPAVLASLLVTDGRDADALRLADSLEARHPRGADVRALMHHVAALALDRMGHTDEALGRNAQALAEGPTSIRAAAWVHHARLEHLRRRDDLAAAALDSARRAQPGLPPLDPHAPPGLDSPLVRGWGMAAAPSAVQPSPPSAAPSHP